MEDIEKMLENESLKEFSEKDMPRFIAVLFLVHWLKKEFPDLSHFSYFQFNSKIKSLKHRSEAIDISYSYIQKENKLWEYATEALNEVYYLDDDRLKKYLLQEIVSYLHQIRVFDDDLEKLERRFVTAQLGDIFVMSSFVKRYMFEEKPTITSIHFNFYDERVNLLTAIYYDLKGIKYAISSSIMPSFPEGKQFNNIILFPPYKNAVLMQQMVGAEKAPENVSASFEWKIITNLLSYLSAYGQMVAIVSSGALNKVADSQSRKALIDQKLIGAVIELPRLSLVSFPLSLISFGAGHQQISVINATKFAQNLRRGVNLDSDKIVRALTGQIEGALGKLDIDYAKENGYDLTPHRFFEETNANFVNPTPLKKITTAIFRGFQIPSDMLDEYASEKETKIKLLTLTSIEDGQVVRDSLQSLKAVGKKMEHYILEKGDLVISCKGKTFKTAVIDIPYGETYISTGSLIVIRCDQEKLDPMYLKIFLDADLGTRALRRIQTGTSVLSLNPSKLQNIQIPLPHLSKQMLISSSFRYKLQNIKEVKDVIDEMRQEMDKKFNKNFLSLLN